MENNGNNDEQELRISQSISQGEHRENTQENSRLQEASDYLRRSMEPSRQDAQADSSAISQFKQLEFEAKAAEDFAKENHLWLSYFDLELGLPYKGGNENDNYIDIAEQMIYKVNNLFNCRGSVVASLDNIAAHNKLFPNTAYELVGFTGFEGRNVYPIYKQNFISNASEASPEEISNYMTMLGFLQLNEHTFTNSEYTVSDLRPRNVLKDIDGDIYVIDNIIIQNK